MLLPLHRSLDYSEALDRVVVGTNHCTIKEISGDTVVGWLVHACVFVCVCVYVCVCVCVCGCLSCS